MMTDVEIIPETHQVIRHTVALVLAGGVAQGLSS